MGLYASDGQSSILTTVCVTQGGKRCSPGQLKLSESLIIAANGRFITLADNIAALYALIDIFESFSSLLPKTFFLLIFMKKAKYNFVLLGSKARSQPRSSFTAWSFRRTRFRRAYRPPFHHRRVSHHRRVFLRCQPS